MPAVSRIVPALTGVLLLAACGSQSASQGSAGADASCPSASPSDGPVEDGVKVTCATDRSVEFEVTNSQAEAATYTVTFGIRGGTAGGVENVTGTVEAVGPGRTVKGSVDLGETMAPEVSGVEVVKVRSVPVGEASSASGPCPASGVHVYADAGDAAMGLRVVGLHLVNCGSEPYRLDGYPKLQLLDEEHESVDGVRILQGTEQISTAAGGDGSPQPVVLQPGEAARTTLAWRNTTEAGVGDPVNVPYVRVRAKSGSDPVMVVPELDLGTTGKLGVGPWKTDETYRGADTAPTTPTTPTAPSRPTAPPPTSTPSP